MRTARVAELLAAVVLVSAVGVIVYVPELLRAPNPLAFPAAMVVLAGALASLVGGRAGRWTALIISLLGLVLCVLWYLLATDGFGQGTPWLDDMAEAGVLAVVFLGAALLVGASMLLRRRVWGRTVS